ncbi:hypothetical protein [Streptomyces sp. V1I6]|nr:hypothetical protein [Streptomyces sp. V1I6]MDQ0841248.1 hypothetical protein [Streptomyces sp. V1I6]
MRKRRAADRDDAQSHHQHHARGESITMNLITNLLAGVVHFVGWLV